MHPFSPQSIANSGLSGAGGVDQGQYSDCVFEASMAAVATTTSGQAAIAQMIVQNSDGSYTVTFPGDAQNPVTLTQSVLTAAGVSDSSTWADILEAALLNSNISEFANGAQLPSNATGAADGSPPTPAQYALYLLTGNLASKDVASSPDIGAEINQALGNDQPVVAYCANNDQGALVSGHEWTVISCMASNPQGIQITLRNPWGSYGNSGTTQDGVTYDGNAEVTMSLANFGQYYEEVTFGNIPTGLIGQVVLAETSTNSPALASLNGLLYLAWTGVGNNQLNVNCSADNGVTFAGKKIGEDTSQQAPVLCACQGNLFIAWTGVGNNNLNVSIVNVSGNKVSGFSGKVTLMSETSLYSPALASLNGLLYLAWTGVGNNQLNVAVSLNNGTSFVNKYVSTQTSTAAPALTVQNGVLYIAWKGDGNDNLNIGQVAISGNAISKITNVVTLPDTSKNSPALASNGNLYLSWKGDGNTNLNVESSTNGGQSFSNKLTSVQTSNVAPALGSLNHSFSAGTGSSAVTVTLESVYIAWTGVDNNFLNVAQVSG
jgi:hypothetical protein